MALLALKLFVPAIDDALIVFGVLQIAFGENDIAYGRRILGQSEIFLANLVRRAANTYIGAVAVIYLVAVLRAIAALLAAAVMLAAILTALAAIVAAIAGASVLCSVSHLLHPYNVFYFPMVFFLSTESYTGTTIPDLRTGCIESDDTIFKKAVLFPGDPGSSTDSLS